MTIAAVACLALTAARSSALTVAVPTGWAVSPWGPLLSTAPVLIAARADSAFFTSGLLASAVPAAVVELHPTRPTSTAPVAAIRAAVRLITILLEQKTASRRTTGGWRGR